MKIVACEDDGAPGHRRPDRGRRAAHQRLAGAAQSGAPLHTTQTSTVLPPVFVAGSVPITAHGVTVGAVGAAGGSPQQDHRVARRAAATRAGGSP